MSSSLEEYWRKRNFDATAEPAGDTSKSGSKKRALQYCIQKHAARRLHYDFRLELDGTLKSWAVPKGPSLDPKARRLAVHVEDHPLEYATFEGNIPSGEYGAGEVIVWDHGEWIPQGDPTEGYTKGKLKFELQGEKLSGTWNLVRSGLQGGKEQWFLIKSNDEAALPEKDYSITDARPDSVISDHRLEPLKKAAAPKPRAIKKPARRRIANTNQSDDGNLDEQVLTGAAQAALPSALKPQLATLVDSAPAGDWRYEIKFDGYRVMARIDNGEVRLFTRNGLDWTDKMPRQTEALAALALKTGWLDGEVVVPDENGLPDFQALQNAFNEGQSDTIVFYLFDVPFLNGRDLRKVALEQRRAVLASIMKNSDSDILRYSDDFAEPGEAMLNSACELKLEGLIGKRAGSGYTSRRSRDWIKLKCVERHEFVVVGYTEPRNSRSFFGALLLGLHDEASGTLRYAGKVGTGFDAKTLKYVWEKMTPLEVKRPNVSNRPTGADAKGVHWLQPVLLAEVAYAQMTREGIVRHCVFHGLREDKPASEITRERPLPAKAAKAGPRSKKTAPAKTGSEATLLGISHPDRVIDPSTGTTKLQLAEYYSAVAHWLEPHLKDRPVALVRAPEGIGGELFFQKHGEKLKIPAVTRLAKGHSGQPAMMLNNAEALIGAVQMNAIELHTWNATREDLDRPDRFILDLDPDPALPWGRMIEAAQLTLTLLDELGLTSFLKTSGGKGIHIVVPLDPGDDWDSVKAFSRAIVKHIAKLMPDRFTAVSGPKNRVGKIFIDYLRNSHGATTICAFAARARSGMAVSTPIFRDELDHLKGADVWTIHNLMDRLANLESDPWKSYDSVRQTITAEMRDALGVK